MSRTMTPQAHDGRPQKWKAYSTPKPKKALAIIQNPFVNMEGDLFTMVADGPM